MGLAGKMRTFSTSSWSSTTSYSGSMTLLPHRWFLLLSALLRSCGESFCSTYWQTRKLPMRKWPACCFLFSILPYLTPELGDTFNAHKVREFINQELHFRHDQNQSSFFLEKCGIKVLLFPLYIFFLLLCLLWLYYGLIISKKVVRTQMIVCTCPMACKPIVQRRSYHIVSQ